MPDPVFKEPKAGGVLVEDDLAQNREFFNYSEAENVLLNIRELIDKTDLPDVKKAINFSDIRAHLSKNQFDQLSSAFERMHELNEEIFNINDRKDFDTIKKNSIQLVEILNTLSNGVRSAGIEGSEQLLQTLESNTARYQTVADHYQRYLELNQKELEANFKENIVAVQNLESELKQGNITAENFQKAATIMQEIEQLRDSAKLSSNDGSNINEKTQPVINKLKFIQQTILNASVADFDSTFAGVYKDILQKTRTSIHPKELQDLQAKHDLAAVQLGQFRQAYGNNDDLDKIEKRMNDRLNRLPQEVKVDQKEDANKNYLLYEFNAILSNASIPPDKKAEAINHVIGKLPPDPSNLDNAIATLEEIQKNLNKQLDKKNVTGLLSNLSVTKAAIETIHKEKVAADKVVDLDAVASLQTKDTNMPSSPRMR